MNHNAIKDFAALHNRASPLLLYNIWDAGSAAALERSGASAVATGSFSMAGARGFMDGEAFPLPSFLETVREIVGAVSLPVTADFVGGYAMEPDQVAENARHLAETGVVGCNFEDWDQKDDAIISVDDQAERIKAVRESGLFINARTDVFIRPLLAGYDPDRANLVDEAVERANAYEEAGANGIFVPALRNPDLIADFCERVRLPVNIMMLDGMADLSTLRQTGVARISWGPAPWRDAMNRLEADARLLYHAANDP